MKKEIKKKDCFRLSVRSKENVDPSTWRVRPLEENGISVLEAREKGDKVYNIYTYRFDVKMFTLGSARLWLNSKGIQEIRMTELRGTLHEAFEKLRKKSNG